MQENNCADCNYFSGIALDNPLQRPQHAAMNKSFTPPLGMTKTEIAAKCGVNKSTVTRWFAGRIPAERAIDLERVTGIPRQTIRPDLFGKAVR